MLPRVGQPGEESEAVRSHGNMAYRCHAPIYLHKSPSTLYHHTGM